MMAPFIILSGAIVILIGIYNERKGVRIKKFIDKIFYKI